MHTTNRLPQFQGLRAVAFMAIFICHSHMGNFYPGGAWGVSVFFILSGFLMVCRYWYQEKELSFGIQFPYQKIKKLYPLHIATMLSCIVISIYEILRGTKEIKELIISTALNVSLTKVWIPYSKYYSSLNSVSWYLCVCTFTYFCFPLILQGVKRIKNNKQAGIGIVLLFILQISVSLFAFFFGNTEISSVFSVQWITYVCPLTRLIDFCIGCCLGYIYLHTEKQETISQVYTSAEIGICILIVLSWSIYTFRITFLGSAAARNTVLFTPTTLALIWVTARKCGWISKVLSTKMLVKIGDLSPYTFLIHKVVIRYCEFLLNELLHINNIFVLFVVSIILTFIAAELWLIIERRKEWYCQEKCAKRFAGSGQNEISRQWRCRRKQSPNASCSCISCCPTGCQPHGGAWHRPA